ncbi:MAG: polysaccharide pyruvyl transferase family protein [Chlamydiota bacterium]
MKKHNIYWWAGKLNVGDLIGPYLASKILEKPLPNEPAEFPGAVALCGSVLMFNIKFHWGTGLIKKDIVPDRHIFAVRGPLTQYCCIRSGYSPDDSGVNILGDPGLLLSRFYLPKGKVKSYKLGIIPHYNDKEIVLKSLASVDLKSMKIKVLDVQQGVETFIDELLECESTVSSSLHGLVLSISYGIPTRWVKFSSSLHGDDLKFYDFLLALETNHEELVNAYVKNPHSELLKEFHCINFEEEKFNVDILFEIPKKYKVPQGMLENLLASFPKHRVYIKGCVA